MLQVDSVWSVRTSDMQRRKTKQQQMNAYMKMQGFFQLFAQGGGGKLILYGLLRGQVCIHVQSMWQNRGSGGMLPREILILDLLLLDAIWWNLGLLLHKHK